MRATRTPLRLLAATALAGAVGVTAALPAVSAPAEPANDHAGIAARGHVRDLPDFVKKWEAQRARAASQVSTGIARTHDAGSATLDSGEVVPFGTTQEAYILTVLADFSDLPQGSLDGKSGATDNSTYEPSATDRAHFEAMILGDGADGNPSMRQVYEEMSSGRHAISGEVTDWVTLPGTQADYGANGRRDGAGSDNLNGPVYRIVRDAIALIDGSSLGPVDVWDRYDCDGDENFDEPDGYVDHFQLVHAGSGEEAGASPDAIWSHRWYANGAGYGVEGPSGCLLGGYQIAGSDVWVGDYTVEPEDGGVGVFVHEYAHDWGIPDFYDTSGGGENGTGFWTLMSSGSWASTDADAIGTNPVPMGAPEKEQLGWYAASGSGDGALEVVDATTLDGTGKTLTLGPATTATNLGVQALRVSLPDNEQFVPVFAPARGDTDGYWYSRKGDSLDNQIVFDAGPGTLTFSTAYAIEKDWDYAYVEVEQGGVWSSLKINGKSSRTNPNGNNLGNGITGTTNGRWSSARVTLPAGTTGVRFRYVTDEAVAETGFAVDDVEVGGAALALRPAADNEFMRIAPGASGFTGQFEHYYLVELREHVGQDVNLCGAYNFSFGTDQVEKNCYAEGVLIWYVNTYYADNNTSRHNGGGLALPVDLRPEVLTTAAGTARSRLQVWDAPLTDAITQSFTLTGNVAASWSAGHLPVFADTSTTAYWNASLPLSTVKTAGSGVRVELVSKGENTATVKVSKP